MFGDSHLKKSIEREAGEEHELAQCPIPLVGATPQGMCFNVDITPDVGRVRKSDFRVSGTKGSGGPRPDDVKD